MKLRATLQVFADLVRFETRQGKEQDSLAVGTKVLVPTSEEGAKKWT